MTSSHGAAPPGKELIGVVLPPKGCQLVFPRDYRPPRWLVFVLLPRSAVMPDPASAPLVLVADGHPVYREVMGDALAAAGFYPMLAGDGQAVLELAQRHQPSLILLGVVMAKGNGYATLRRLRADSRTGGIPVVILTGCPAPSFAALSRELGAVAHLTKPVTPTELIEAVSGVLGLVETAAA